MNFLVKIFWCWLWLNHGTRELVVLVTNFITHKALQRSLKSLLYVDTAVIMSIVRLAVAHGICKSRSKDFGGSLWLIIYWNSTATQNKAASCVHAVLSMQQNRF